MKPLLEPLGFEDQVEIFAPGYNKGFIMDFFCRHYLVRVEIDGAGHKASRDARNDRKLWAELGIRTWRFPNAVVDKDPIFVRDMVVQRIREFVIHLVG